ncbi:hypothetical protein D9M72_439910 [compost metagenome]
MDAAVVAKHVVRGERGVRKIPGAGLIACRGVDLVAGGFRHGDLGDRQHLAGRCGVAHGFEDFEVDVRPASVVCPGVDGGERHLPVGIRFLDTAEEVLIFKSGVVHRVFAVPVAVPGVDGGAGKGFAAAGVVQESQGDRQRDAFRLGGGGSEAGGDVLPDHAGRLQDVGPVGPVGTVSGIGPSCFLRNFHAAFGDGPG